MSATSARPADFEQYWDAIDQELRKYPPAPELAPLPLRSSEICTVYGVRLTSIGPYRIFGYYSVPTGAGPFPGLIHMPGYGSVNHVPPYEERGRYAVLQVMHRGQRLADEPFAAVYPGLLTHGIDDPRTYIYRSIAADCIRGLEFLVSRPEVDSERVGVIGNDLALISAARRPGTTAIQAAGLMFYRMMDARERTDAYPIEEVNDYLRARSDHHDKVKHTLAYFDPCHHGPQIAARTLLSVGEQGSLNGPDWLELLSDSIAGPVEHYQLTHEGGTDQAWLDSWLADCLNTEPWPKMWDVVE